MNETALDRLVNLVERKRSIDQRGSWSEGSSTYLNELRKEIDEVEMEVGRDRRVFLEDELGDVLWDYLNLLRCLVEEESVSMTSVFERAAQKYEERIANIERGGTWKEVKANQKALLQEEHDSRL